MDENEIQAHRVLIGNIILQRLLTENKDEIQALRVLMGNVILQKSLTEEEKELLKTILP